MHIDILTLFPDMIKAFFENSIMARAVEKGIITYNIINFRDYTYDNHHTCDDIPYGGGAGMVLKPEPLFDALNSINAAASRVIFPTPSGKLFNQDYANSLSKEERLTFICGHYEGLDQRVIDEWVDDEISIGDYVLTSGETSSIVIIDAIFRLIDGVISKESLEDESFSSPLLEYPQYTRPERYCQKNVPDVLLSGHHERIATWRVFQRLEKTMLSRPEVLTNASLDVESRKKFIQLLDIKGFGKNGLN
ncbi:tRNA (guanosine(37)-N1)-methyltransferase TrmD [Bullifex sp.]|uniref:tRNA (guanosine(37)-N1)-methyltransferase TrmD n=1 Tax=Bullifex sp. TaxID=2815808 RepID=UPI002A83D22B|nr:tRNA (guanosine(37)-N1)-methyltransferase TrmD [Bullifex sp.]MDY4067154.1 tRNA (guanosine(37)-N1)-methyltransferase TrmD [Bullifex sp.]